MFDNIRGIITFEAVSDAPETFLNLLKESPVQVSDVRYKKGVITGNIYRNDLPYVSELAAKNGTMLSIAAQKGKIFTIRKYRFRIGILLGIIIASFLIFYLSNIVMTVEIYGNETLTDKQVISILSDFGIKNGAFIPALDLRDIERQIVSSVDDIAWIGIRSSGCMIQAEISEMKDPPEMIPANTPCNIVSSRDAQIVDVKKVHMGMLVPMLYDGVKKGDILVSGTVEDGKGGIYYVHSIGEIIGRYTEKVTFSQPYIDEKISYSDKVTRKSLTFFGLKIPLYVGKNDFDHYEYNEKTELIRLFDMDIPIGTVISEYRPYETESVTYSPEKAEQILEDKIKTYERNFYSDENITVVDKEIFFEETNNGINVTAKYTIEGDIGVSKEIMVK